jgi:hypothetical protein
MCLISSEELEPEELYDFLVDLQAPLKELIFVKSNVRWVHSLDSGHWMIGAAVLESTRSWLGALENQIH